MSANLLIMDLVLRHARSVAGGLVLFVSTLSPAFPADAGPKVTCEVRVVARHTSLVTFTWDLRVESERAWDACDVIISFVDDKGREVHSLRETVRIKTGRSTFSGHDVCDSGVWDRIARYVTTFDCLF